MALGRLSARHRWGVVALWLTASLAAAQSAPDPSRHLLQGARHFRDGRFGAALVEFKVARELGARGQVDWYVAATLARLDRAEDAVEAFAIAESSAPGAHDVLLDWYHAMACSDAQLLLRADAILTRVGSAAGPKITALVATLRSQIAEQLREPPSAKAIDALIVRAHDARAKRPELARVLLEEAAALAARRSDRHRSAEIDLALRKDAGATEATP